jgi:hypothetical protein
MYVQMWRAIGAFLQHFIQKIVAEDPTKVMRALSSSIGLEKWTNYINNPCSYYEFHKILNTN